MVPSAISISSGSEKDSNTRTKSCLLAWGISASFFHPIDLEAATFEKKQSYVMSSIRNKKKYILNLLNNYKVVKKWVNDFDVEIPKHEGIMLKKVFKN